MDKNLFSLLIITVLTYSSLQNTLFVEQTEGTIQKKMNSNELTITLMYTPWCKFCKGIKPMFTRAISTTNKFYLENSSEIKSSFINLFNLKDLTKTDLDNSLKKTLSDQFSLNTYVSFNSLNLDKNLRAHRNLGIGQVPDLIITKNGQNERTHLNIELEKDRQYEQIEYFLKEFFLRNTKEIESLNEISENEFGLYCDSSLKYISLLKNLNLEKLSENYLDDLYNSMVGEHVQKVFMMQKAFKFSNIKNSNKLNHFYVSMNQKVCDHFGIKEQSLTIVKNNTQMVFSGDYTFTSIRNFFIKEDNIKDIPFFNTKMLQDMVTLNKPVVIYISMSDDYLSNPNYESEENFESLESYREFKERARSFLDDQHENILFTKLHHKSKDFEAVNFSNCEETYKDNKNKLNFDYDESFMVVVFQFKDYDIKNFVYTNEHSNGLYEQDFKDFIESVISGKKKEHLKTEDLLSPEDQTEFVKRLNTDSFLPFLKDPYTFKGVLFYGGKQPSNTELIQIYENVSNKFYFSLYDSQNPEEFGKSTNI